jgi:hypothetical protein
MDTEFVRAQAQKIYESTAQLFIKLAELKSARAHLSMGWFAEEKSERFYHDLNNWIKNCETQTDALQCLSLRLGREVDEWESADLNGKERITAPYLGPVAGIISSGVIATITDSSGVDLDYGIDISGDSNLLGWTEKAGKKTYDDGKLSPGVEAHIGLEGAAWGKETKITSDTGSVSGNVQLGHAEAGIKGGIDKDGVYAGAYAGFDAAKASGTAVLGSALFGFTVGGTVKAGSLSASGQVQAGANGVSAEVGAGASLVSGDVDIGMNVAGANVGVTAGVSVGFKIGITIGSTTKVNLGPFTIGLHIGKAIT